MANRNAHTIAAFDCNRVDSDNISNLDSLSGSGNYKYIYLARVGHMAT